MVVAMNDHYLGDLPSTLRFSCNASIQILITCSNALDPYGDHQTGYSAAPPKYSERQNENRKALKVNLGRYQISINSRKVGDAASRRFSEPLGATGGGKVSCHLPIPRTALTPRGSRGCVDHTGARDLRELR